MPPSDLADLRTRTQSALIAIGLPQRCHELDTPERVRSVLGAIWEACAIADKAGVGRRVREQTRAAEALLTDLELELRCELAQSVNRRCYECGKAWSEWAPGKVADGLEYRSCHGFTLAKEVDHAAA